jgi:hypothetical protein
MCDNIIMLASSAPVGSSKIRHIAMVNSSSNETKVHMYRALRTCLIGVAAGCIFFSDPSAIAQSPSCTEAHGTDCPGKPLRPSFGDRDADDLLRRR